MKLKKAAFLQTDFGKELASMITTWDQALERNSPYMDCSEKGRETLKQLAWCQAQWEVYRMAIKHFYGVEYNFSRTDEYYGLCTEDEKDWLMKVDRKPIGQKSSSVEREIEDVVIAITAGIESLQKSTGTFSSQRVTRRGIKVDGVEYWDADFVHLNLGRLVIVEATPWLIRVYTESGTPLHLFYR